MCATLVSCHFALYVQDQLEADDNLTPEQRLALAGGSALKGVGDAVGSDAIGIAGYSKCTPQHIDYVTWY